MSLDKVLPMSVLTEGGSPYGGRTARGARIRGDARVRPCAGGEILHFVQDDSTAAAFRFSSKLKSENQNKNQIKKRMRKQAFTSFFDSLDRLLHGPLEEVLQRALGVGKGKRRAAPGREAH